MPESTFDYQRCLEACAQGDQQALRDLYTQESARLLGVAWRIVRERAVAEDIVHDAFVRIWTRASSFAPERGSARGWIYSITRNLALNFVRDGARQVAIDPQDPSHLQDTDPAHDPEHAMHSFELHAHSAKVYRCLEQLEPARRDCILHAYVDGCTHAQIAQRLGTPLGTVKAWIKRGLAALRECMG
ncbi:RNA polymerase sigma-70 factor (ECF subfamily) [Pseudomonas hunanensis]|uniref:RNA polymerase sigma-70 factor (ECF subfamily) n=1 Tax=Pseudomonas hunanensis TaxID=1247546 RepID=A0ACC6K5S8_9PSED|nr:sigma-70 family RNA polymerase sigma factor [Pseudomonas hunanensis]MDR6713765.1 RNA polymerase sigma-70 factor (ECF subfamily) [Pseudomonas hunanensis]